MKQRSIADMFGGSKGSTSQAKPKASSKSKAAASKSTTKKATTKKAPAKKSKKVESRNESDDEEYEAQSDDDEDSDHDVDASLDDEVDSDLVEDEFDTVEKKQQKAVARKAKGLDLSLPPISNITDIFTDIVKRFHTGLNDVAETLNGRPLRVATMCSGTESPLLALDMVRECLKAEFNIDFPIKHVFSCEIEPFKQAYIERNFHPPLLFRDVCELGQDEAHTAYGALAPVPGDVDVLVAGTSCVDYSNLNNKQKKITQGGESGRTFFGMLDWVNKHRPAIVILENVCKAPWADVVNFFEKKGYSAHSGLLDTKEYYIPHTRTRGYLIAINKKGSSVPKTAMQFVKDNQRKASSTIESFLLPNDDPRIHEGRAKQVKEGYNSAERKSGRTDWTRCQMRHVNARNDEGLGQKRPYTKWSEGGTAVLPMHAWADWGGAQVERVWDLLDIETLRHAKESIDPQYKTLIWNLSQNVDRNIGSSQPGISMCMTPAMIPFHTGRGGPLTGLEALYLQGLPIDKILLTKETEDNMADLAGNAMSTTVVGMCIISALIHARKLLEGQERADDGMEVDLVPAAAKTIDNEDWLEDQTVDLSQPSPDALSLPEILSKADMSARLCICEGRIDMVKRPLLICDDCGITMCEKCHRHPEHNTKSLTIERLRPSEFTDLFSKSLPMVLQVANVTRDILDATKASAGVAISAKFWDGWCQAVLTATQSQLRFVELRRQEQWTVVYRSPTAILELLLDSKYPEWHFFALPEVTEPANSKLREVLLQPVGRMPCIDDLFDGSWSFALPAPSTVSITIEGSGDLVPSWQNRLGILKFSNDQVWSHIDVDVPDAPDAQKFDHDIRGQYTLLPQCGTANSALHKRTVGEGGASTMVYLLFDPDRITHTDDPFVFSTSLRSYGHDEARPILGRLDTKWRQSSKVGKQTVNVVIPFVWEKKSDVIVRPVANQIAKLRVPGANLHLEGSVNACDVPHAFLSASVPLNGQAGKEWDPIEFRNVTAIEERPVLKGLTWLIEPSRHVIGDFSTWHEVTTICPAPDGGRDHVCERCAPTPPKIQWRLVKKGKTSSMVAFEDNIEAGKYERALKARPPAFVTQLHLNKEGEGQVKIGINLPSLYHRALSRLPRAKRGIISAASDAPITVSWRLDTHFTPSVSLGDLAKFTMQSNRQDPESKQPPHFKKYPLRPEQLRSLHWMVDQERQDIQPFVEQEIVEVVQPVLGWRAEGRATREVKVCGGVLADQVGYGKTAVSLGLIDIQASNPEFKKTMDKRPRPHGKILTNATLVILPGHLCIQWKKEAEKFISTDLNIVSLSKIQHLKSVTVEQIQEADLVLVAESLFSGDVYLKNLAEFAGVAHLPEGKDGGRHFDDKLDKMHESLRDMVELLVSDEGGAQAVFDEIVKAQKKVDKEAEEAAANVPSKRLKGQKYADSKAMEDASKDIEEDHGNSESAPVTFTAKKASVTNRGRIPEVVISSRHSSPSSHSASSSRRSTPPTTPAGDSDEDMAVELAPRRRKSTKVSYVDEDESEDEVVVSHSKAKGKGRGKGKVIDSDDEFEDPGEEDDAEDTMDTDDAASEVSGSRSSVPPSSDMSDDMEVDDEPPKLSKKRKSEGGREPPPKKRKADTKAPPKKKEKAYQSDPWHLKAARTQRHWEEMKCPAMELFQFARIIIDEYTYLKGQAHSMIIRLGGECKWVLSGTPPVHNFAAVRTISEYLGIHLGVSDGTHVDKQKANKLQKELTAVERFYSYIDVPTLDWQRARQEVGQRFLDQFVRQNVAEIDEIPMKIQLEVIKLPASEYAIYLELEHYLRAQEMVVKKVVKRGTKTKEKKKGKDADNSEADSKLTPAEKRERRFNDREKRLNDALGESASAEEALLKACSHFRMENVTTDVGGKETAIQTCDLIIAERTEQRGSCEKDLLEALKDAVDQQKKLNSHPVGETAFLLYLRNVRRGDDVDGEDVKERLNVLFDKAGCPPDKKASKDVDMSTLSPKVKEMILTLRESTHDLRRLTRELGGRCRSLRYFEAVRKYQNRNENPTTLCPRCGTDKPVDFDDVAILSSCGHVGCHTHVSQYAGNQGCVDPTCKVNSGGFHVVLAKNLGKDRQADFDGKKHFGAKLERVVEIIKKEIPKKERVLVFVQFSDLLAKVKQAFGAHGIDYLTIDGNAEKMSKALQSFQDLESRVLLLEVMDSRASGANLAMANHAIFLSPLSTFSTEEYDACETQAIGRVRRYGQVRPVTVWQCVTENTIDHEIYKQRLQHIREKRPAYIYDAMPDLDTIPLS